MAVGRVVSILLTANTTGFVSGMAAAKASAAGLSTSLNGQNAGFSTLSKVAAGFGVAAALGVGKAVSAFSDFDSAMSEVAAATMTTGSELDALGEAALEAGQSTVFSATEAADAITNLAKAGISTSDIMGGALTGALDLAAAGELDVGTAAEIAATAMTQFGLSGEDVPHIADLLAAAAGKAQGSVTDMAAALDQSGLVAAQMGLSIEETTGTLAAFASAGLTGSDAGTSFKTMLLRLANPSQEAADLMKELGISAYDAQGNFVGMESMAGQLQDKLGGLTQQQRDTAMATIFGSDAIRAANVLYNEGSDGIASWTDKVDDAGYASEQAAIKTDNLKGDLERLGGAFDSLLITIGSGFDAALRGVVQAVTNLVDGFNNLDGTAIDGFFAAVGETAGNLWQIMVNLWDALGPVIVGFGQLAAGAIMGGLSLIADALAAITGFLAENETLVTALAIAVGVGLVTSFVRAQVAAVQAMAAMAGMSTLSMVAAITGVTGFTTVLGAAATAAGRLVTALLPLAAVTAVAMLVIEIASMGDTADEAREQISTMWDTINSAETSTDRITAVQQAIDQTKTSVEDLKTELAETTSATDFGNAILVALGAVGDTEEAIALYVAELERLEAEQKLVGENTTALSEEFGISADKVLDLADKYGIDLTGSLDDLTPKMRALLEADQKTTASQEAAAVAAAALATGYLDTAEAADALLTIMEEMTGQFQSSLEAETAYEAGLREMAALFEEIGTAGVDAAGNLDLTTEAGGKLSEQLIANSDDINEVIDALVREGDTEGALAAATDLRARFLADADAMGLSVEEATRLADGLLGIPSEVATAIEQTGAQEAEEAADDFGGALENIPFFTSVGVEVTGTEDGGNKVEGLGGALGDLPVVTYPDVSVTGTEDSWGKVGAVHEALGALPEMTNPDVSVTGTADSWGKTKAVHEALGDLPGGTYPDVSVTGTEDSWGKVKAVHGSLEDLPDVTYPGVEATGTENSWGKVKSVHGALGDLPRVTYPDVSITGAESSWSKTKSVHGALGALPGRTSPDVSITGAESSWSRVTSVGGALGSLPRGTYPDVRVNAEYSGAWNAKSAIDSVQSKTVYVNTVYSKSGDWGGADGGYFPGYAGGGPVWGAGTGRSDSINARLSTGEFVTNADDTSRNRSALEAGNRGARLMVVPGFAGGGVVYGSVSQSEWDRLKRLGWRGRAGDNQEALYPPAPGGAVVSGTVSESKWEQLKAAGWTGRAGDNQEALYPPAGWAGTGSENVEYAETWQRLAAAAWEKNGPAREAANSQGSKPRMSSGGYAGGGPASRAAPGTGSCVEIDYNRLAAAVAKHPILMDGRVVTTIVNQTNQRNAVR